MEKYRRYTESVKGNTLQRHLFVAIEIGVDVLSHGLASKQRERLAFITAPR